MSNSSNQSDLLATTIASASLTELQSILRNLRQMRIIRKQAGKKAFNQTGVRVELPVGSDKSSAEALLKKLEISDETIIEYIENPKLLAGIRVFIEDNLYDGSFTTLTQNINH